MTLQMPTSRLLRCAAVVCTLLATGLPLRSPHAQDTAIDGPVTGRSHFRGAHWLAGQSRSVYAIIRETVPGVDLTDNHYIFPN